MLNESYRQEAEGRLQDISVVSIPHLKEEDARRLTSTYRRAAQDILDLTDRLEDTNNSGIHKLKQLFNE